METFPSTLAFNSLGVLSPYPRHVAMLFSRKSQLSKAMPRPLRKVRAKPMQATPRAIEFHDLWQSSYFDVGPTQSLETDITQKCISPVSL